MKSLLLALIIWTGLFSPVFAQISQQTITNDITNNLPNNNRNEINAQLLRNTLNEMTSAIFQLQGINGLTITNIPSAGQSLVATSSTTANWQIFGNGATCNMVNVFTLTIVNGIVTSCGLGPSIAIGTGLDFTSKISALYVQPSLSLQNNAPWTLSMGVTISAWPLSNTTLIETNPINEAANSTGFRLLNFSDASDVAFGITGFIRPYPSPSNCSESGVVCTRSSRYADGIRHWWTWTFDGALAKLYIDNELIDISIPASSSYIPSTVPWQIGTSNTAINLTEIAYYPTALSASDVQTLYAYNSTGVTPTTGSLVTSRKLYFPTGSGNCNTSGCTDSSGNHNNGIFDSTPPTVAILTPSNGATVSGSQNLTASCSDIIACASVAWQIDSLTVSTQTTAPYTFAWNSAKYVDGVHTITAVGTNVANVTMIASINVTTNNGVSAQSYFFAAAGNDSNNCKTSGTACLTIAKANTLEYHGGDSLLFNAGDSFTLTTSFLKLCGAGVSGCTQNMYPAGVSYPFTISTYGGGTCAPLSGTRTGCVTFTLNSSSTLISGIELFALSNVTVSNFIVNGATATVLAASAVTPGIFVDTTSVNMVVTNNEVIDWNIGIYWDGGSGTITGSITNNYVHGSTSAATLDTGIWVRFVGANNVLVQGNLVENIGGHASGVVPGGSGNPILIADGANNIIDQMNVTRNSGINTTTCGGPAGNWVFNASNVLHNNNESYGMTFASGCDGDGFDIDGGAQNVLMEYDYAHGNKGGGFITFMATEGANAWTNNTIRYSISENDASGCLDTTCGAFFITNGVSSTGPQYLYNLTIWNGINANGTSRSSAIAIESGCPGPGSYIANNLFASVQDHFGTVLHANLNSLAGGCPSTLWKNNGWFAVTGTTLLWQRIGASNAASLAAWQGLIPGGDTNANTSNPNFVGTGGAGGTCYSSGVPGGPQPCPTPYALNSGSPDRSAGINLTQAPYSLNVGTSDYYANVIPGSGPCYNIGAYGICP